MTTPGVAVRVTPPAPLVAGAVLDEVEAAGRALGGEPLPQVVVGAGPRVAAVAARRGERGRRARGRPTSGRSSSSPRHSSHPASGTGLELGCRTCPPMRRPDRDDTAERSESGEIRTPAVDAVLAAGIEHTVTRHGRVSSLEEAAAARGIEPRDLIKTLVVRRAEDDHVFVLVPGDRTFSWAKVRALLGTNRISMPDAAAAKAVTGYERGTITPFGSATRPAGHRRQPSRRAPHLDRWRRAWRRPHGAGRRRHPALRRDRRRHLRRGGPQGPLTLPRPGGRRLCSCHAPRCPPNRALDAAARSRGARPGSATGRPSAGAPTTAASTA